jgi:hypothetical protein
VYTTVADSQLRTECVAKTRRRFTVNNSEHYSGPLAAMVNTNSEGYRRVNGSQRKLNGAVVAKLVRWNSGLENRPSAEFFPSFLWFSFALFSHDKYGTVDHSAWSLFEGPCLPDKEENEMTPGTWIKKSIPARCRSPDRSLRPLRAAECHSSRRIGNSSRNSVLTQFVG